MYAKFAAVRNGNEFCFEMYRCVVDKTHLIMKKKQTIVISRIISSNHRHSVFSFDLKQDLFLQTVNG